MLVLQQHLFDRLAALAEAETVEGSETDLPKGMPFGGFYVPQNLHIASFRKSRGFWSIKNWDLPGKIEDHLQTSKKA